MNRFKITPLVAFTAASLTAIGLGGCNGDDDDTPAASTLGGTAAVGLPIVGGTVNVSCAGGSALTDTTENDGTWEVTITGQTLPCAVQISSGTVGGNPNTTPYHSIAFNLGTVNITPLTDMIVANFTGQTNLSNWFTGLSANTISQFNSTALNTAMTNVRTAISGLDTALGNSNPFTTAFTATEGNAMDDILEAIADAITGAGTNYSAMVTAMAGSTITLPGTDFTFNYTAPSNGGGSNDQTLPAALSSKVMDLTYQNAQTNSPYTNGTVLKFTFSESGKLFLGNTYRDIGGFTRSQSGEYVWFDAANNVAYAASLKQDGSLNEINLAGSASGTPWYGQFTPTAEIGGGTGGNTGGSTGVTTGTLTVSVSINGATATSFGAAITGVPVPTNQTDFCSDISNDSTFSSIGASGGGTLTVNSCSYSGNTGTISATLNITSPISMTLPYTVTYTYN